ncbi:MAG: periplasmic heavy metal sensor [Alteripontixanthobacter sp.]
MKRWHIALAVLLAALAGSLGALGADRWADGGSDRSLHAFVHDELSLTADQEQRLETLEANFAVEQARLEASARAANARLAQAMEAEHEYGPEVGAAIDEVHERMGALQKATVRHVFAMREILDPDQQRRFDRQVSAALTQSPRD